MMTNLSEYNFKQNTSGLNLCQINENMDVHTPFSSLVKNKNDGYIDTRTAQSNMQVSSTQFVRYYRVFSRP